MGRSKEQSGSGQRRSASQRAAPRRSWRAAAYKGRTPTQTISWERRTAPRAGLDDGRSIVAERDGTITVYSADHSQYLIFQPGGEDGAKSAAWRGGVSGEVVWVGVVQRVETARDDGVEPGV